MEKEEKVKQKLNRRDFMKGMAAGASGIAAGGVWPAYASGSPSGKKSQVPASWDREADVVVLGYGGSGIVAAIAAADPADRIVVFGSFYTVGEVLREPLPRLSAPHVAD